MKHLVKYMLILPLFAIISCSREYMIDENLHSDINEKNVMLKVAVPYVIPNDAATRAIGTTQENTIETLDVLAFKVDGGVQTFLYWANAKKDAGNMEGSSIQSFNATLQVKDYAQRFVLITNARTKIETLISSRTDGWVGQEIEAMLSQLTIDLNGSDRWKAINTSNYTSIPMWGQTEPKVVDAAVSSLSSTPIPLLRMIAKIEVQLDEEVTGITDNFKLKSVHLYNTNTSGRIVPIPGTEYVGANMIAKKASLPYPVTPVVGPLAYTDFSLPGIPNISMRGAIFLFETAAKNSGNFLTETCIVVGGYYGTDTQESYYRLDFFEADGTTHSDILRNHKYTCNIVAVNGRGHLTVDDAYRSKSFNMKAEILVWDEGVIRDIVFDSQYMLGVSQSYFDFSEEEYDMNHTDNILKITTDYPKGWTATVWADKTGTMPIPNDAETGNPWLSINPTFGYGGTQPDEMRLLTAANTGNTGRVAYIHIKAGRLTYIVTVAQDKQAPGKITVTPSWWSLPYTIPNNAMYDVNVTCLKSNGVPDPNASWTLTSANPSWCRLSLSPATAFSSATASISGTGSLTVYIIATDNSGINPRATTIYMGVSSSDVVTDVTQWGNTSTITENEGGGTPPKNTRTYVGAFWKANQTGERVIRIEAAVNSENNGNWTATVVWLDGRWKPGDGVVLSLDKLPGTMGSDPNIYTANPGNAENYQVEGYNTTVSGNVTSSDRYISFRIGLKSTYTPTTQYPARYAVVLLSYANNTKHQKIFLRQGEEADYLMTNNDPVNTGGLSARTVTRKFSPYNLTAVTLDKSVMTQADAANPSTSGNRSKFTDYPTQAGALWQWANTYTGTQFGGGIRWAHNAHTSASQEWQQTNTPDYWNTISVNQEVCPPGYRRPYDGSITGSEACTNISGSEMRQSLFMNPRTSYNYSSETSNSLWGYYADGFFDRLQIVNGNGSGATNTTVAAGSRDIAHIGRLFFNPVSGSDHYNASLFVPASGMRDMGTGSLMFTGIDGYLWSASRNIYSSSNCGLSFVIKDNHSGPWRIEISTGVTIRCIKD